MIPALPIIVGVAATAYWNHVRLDFGMPAQVKKAVKAALNTNNKANLFAFAKVLGQNGFPRSSLAIQQKASKL